MPDNKYIIQNEIKDKVISILLDKICFQHKEISLLNEENKTLKSNLTDMYKKMILFKSSSSYTKRKDGKANQHKLYTANNFYSTYNPRLVNNKTALNKPFSPKSRLIKNNNKTVSRNKQSNDTLHSSQESSIFDNPSFLLSTNDKVNSSRLHSDFSQNGYLMTLSPRKIGQNIQLQTTYRSTKFSFLATEPNVDPRAKDGKIYSKIIEPIEKKNEIKVTITNQKKRPFY